MDTTRPTPRSLYPFVNNILRQETNSLARRPDKNRYYLPNNTSDPEFQEIGFFHTCVHLWVDTWPLPCVVRRNSL
jgi:hypothetical protein